MGSTGQVWAVASAILRQRSRLRRPALRCPSLLIWAWALLHRGLASRVRVNHDALVVAELVLGKSFQRFHRGIFIASNVCGKKIWCTKVVVVTVQAVRNAAKPTESLQPRNNSRLQHIARP